MTIVWVVAVLAIMAVVASMSPVSEGYIGSALDHRIPDKSRVWLFTRTRFRGDRYSPSTSQYDYDPRIWRSVWLPPGHRMTLFAGKNFTGDSRTLFVTDLEMAPQRYASWRLCGRGNFPPCSTY